MWEEDPRATSKAIESFIKLSQQMANEMGGYEISAGIPYVVAFGNPINALNYSLRMQLGIYSLSIKYKFIFLIPFVAARDFAWDNSLLLCTCAREEM